MPGFIDAHFHTMAGARDLEQAAVFGVTTVLDMFMPIVAMAEIKANQSSKPNLRAQLFSSGTLVTAPGGHGTEYGIAIPTISTPEEAAP